MRPTTADLLAYNPGKAEKLLDEAGWIKGSNGIRTKDGKQLSLTLHSNPYLATSKSVDELIAQQLGKIGWKVNIRAYDVVTYGEKVKFGGPAVSGYEVTRSFIDAGTVAGILTDANNGENWFALGESDKKLNDLRDKIASAGSANIRDPLLDELQKYILEQGYFIPRTQIVQRIYVQSPKLKGEIYNGIAYASYYTATKSEVARSATEQREERTGMSNAYLTYAAKRLVQAVVVILLTYVFTFVVVSILPGDPISNVLRDPQNGFTEKQIQEIIAAQGLDQPVLVQLWTSLSNFVTGDLGLSMRSNRPVATLIAEVRSLDAGPRVHGSRRRAAAGGGDRLRHPVPSEAVRSGLAAGLPVVVPVGAQLRDRPGADPRLRLPARPLPRDRAGQLLRDPVRGDRARHSRLRTDRRGAHRQPR